jgi:hypothetical protein
MTPEEVADHAPKSLDVALLGHEIDVASAPRIGTCVADTHRLRYKAPTDATSIDLEISLPVKTLS